MRFTVEDQYLTKCSWINKKSMKQTAILRCFLIENRVLVGYNIFNGENDSSGIIESCLGYGWPHTAYQNLGFLSKVVEKVVDARLAEHVNRHRLLPVVQSAYS